MTAYRSLFLVAAFAAGAVRADALVTERTLSLEAAQEVAAAALERCHKDGYNVTITVLNRAGRSKVVLHDDRANPHTIENSLRKAYTALTFRQPSGDYGKRFVATPQLAGALHLDKITTLEGGLPIMAGKDVVGAIGISGAPGGDKDAVCAQAGIDRIAKGLGG